VCVLCLCVLCVCVCLCECVRAKYVLIQPPYSWPFGGREFREQPNMSSPSRPMFFILSIIIMIIFLGGWNVISNNGYFGVRSLHFNLGSSNFSPKVSPISIVLIASTHAHIRTYTHTHTRAYTTIHFFFNYR